MTEASGDRAVAVVVTFNRLDDLRRCLDAIRGQTRGPNEVLVVDNGSDAPTRDFLSAQDDMRVLRLPSNEGGAGGFAAGLAGALGAGADWVWLMDDDCLPAEDALERLLEVAGSDDTGRVGGVAPLVDYRGGPTEVGGRRDGGTGLDHLDWGPFLGLLLRGKACAEVGLPRVDFFIWNDDFEYCMRLRLAGWEFRPAPRARLEHPGEPGLRRRVLGRTVFTTRVAPPWKAYYEVRNGLIVERMLDGTELAAERGPAGRVAVAVKQIFYGLLFGSDGAARAWLTARGIVDGVRGRTGRRVAPGERPLLLRVIDGARRRGTT
jgi:rhamnopyranosyl-N-acetylglucosaminyl-diphospho-decaprenol beta-1,3/1,4-galactofuranosyltransferase